MYPLLAATLIALSSGTTYDPSSHQCINSVQVRVCWTATSERVNVVAADDGYVERTLRMP